MNINKITFFIIFICFNITAESQIKIMQNDLKEDVKSDTLDYCDGPNYGIRLLLNDKIKKYDKIVVSFVYRKKAEPEAEFESNSFYRFNEAFHLYPTSKDYKVRFEGEKHIDFYLYGNDETKLNRLISKSVYCNYYQHSYMTESEFKIVIKGYLTTDSESYWDGNTLKERDIYTYSKDIMESPVFTFSSGVPAENLWDEMASVEQKDFYKEQMEIAVYQLKMEGWQRAESSISTASNSYKEDEKSKWMLQEFENFKSRYYLILKNNEMPYIGLNVIGMKYKAVREYLLDNMLFKRLQEVENKILAVSDEAKKGLKKELKGQEDPEAITNIFLNYQP